MEIKEVFGRNVRFYRKNRQLSQERLAEILGITNNHLSNIETGNCFVSGELLEKLSASLGVSASALFYNAKPEAGDANLPTKIDEIIDEEVTRAVTAIKTRIRQVE
ncbi:MAG: helix-turn-helix domain-containing protein [Spirochaetaceae bacterium]|jgi:transcriptional regulator with XRE-family HTH domain|nr:helix-turn-helix domain-containing protein [Spirochaetaceae bacterium]